MLEFDNRILLVVVDYFSNYTSRLHPDPLVAESDQIIARFGVPDTLVTDNGPQFAAAEFASFAKTWSFEHVTSSPRYAQANGKAENAVKTVKRMFTKCKEGRQSEYLALLNWRNTPSEGFGTSPVQRLMGRRCKATLPIAGKLLQPQSTTEQDSEALLGMKAKQEHYYNQSAKPLPELNPGNTIRIRLLGDKSGLVSSLQGES